MSEEDSLAMWDKTGSPSNLIHPPDKLDGVLRGEATRALADHLIHHPDKLDGVSLRPVRRSTGDENLTPVRDSTKMPNVSAESGQGTAQE